MMGSMGKRMGFTALILMSAWLVNCSQTKSVAHEEPTLPRTAPQKSEPPDEPQLPQDEISQLQDDDAPVDTTPSPSPEAAPLVHEVKWPGETLYSIALWYTGSGMNWKRLAEANPTVRPRRIRIGDSIRIPAELLKTHQPLPFDFLRPISSRKKPPPPRQPVQRSKKEAVSLYGPVDNGPAAKQGAEKNSLPLPLEPLE